MKKWLGRLAKIGFFLAAFFGVVATVLFNMGGSNVTLQKAIEDYISASTGYAVRIQSFNKMTFFPSISVDMGDIILKQPDLKAIESWAKTELQKPEAEQGQSPLPELNYDNPDAYIEKAIISVGFLDAGFGRGRRLKDLQFRNAKFNAGTLHVKPLTIKTLGIDETPDGAPFIGFEGSLDDAAFNGKLDIQSIGSRSNPKYKLGEEGAFELNIKDIAITGIMRPRTMGGIHIRDLEIIKNGEPVLNTTFSFIREAAGDMEINGEFTVPENGSNGTFNWDIIAENNMQINGKIQAPALHQKDFAQGSRLSETWAKWNDIFVTPNDDKKPVEHKITVNAENFSKASEEFKNFAGKAQINASTILFTQSVE